jgi:hypothetical protein
MILAGNFEVWKIAEAGQIATSSVSGGKQSFRTAFPYQKM